MRQILVDAARRRTAQKRSAGEAVPLAPEICAAEVAFCEETLALNLALENLAALNARQAQVVECRFFAGLNVCETAELLQVSESVIERDWRAAKAWLVSVIQTRKE